jgi:hypothetical protein
MTTEKVLSPIDDPHIRYTLGRSPIWKQAYKEDEKLPEGRIYVYHMKFDGLKPVQLLKVSQFYNRNND